MRWIRTGGEDKLDRDRLAGSVRTESQRSAVTLNLNDLDGLYLLFLPGIESRKIILVDENDSVESRRTRLQWTFGLEEVSPRTAPAYVGKTIRITNVM